MKKKTSVLNVVEKAVTVLLLLFVVCMFVVNMLFYKDTAAPSFGKYYVYIAGEEQSIEKINPKTAVICDSELMNNLQVGNVILSVVNDENDYAIVRIAGMDETTYTLKSDYSEIDDTIVVPKENAVALCYLTSDSFGKFISFATTNAGIVVLIILPLTIVILLKSWSLIEKEKLSEKDNSKYKKEKEKKEKQKKAKAEAKLKKSDEKYNETQEDDVYLITKDENGDTSIVSADDEQEDDYNLSEENSEDETEEPEEINIPDDEQEIAETAENESEEVISVPPVFTEENIETDVTETISEPEEIPVPDISDNQETEDITEPKIHCIINNTESDESNDEIIYRNDIPEKLPDIISEPVYERTEEKSEVADKEEPEIVNKEKSEIHVISKEIKPAPSPKKTSSSSTEKKGNRYSSNRYTNSAVRRSSSKTSVDDLLKTIDSEKSRIHK
jgi:hypothetical protein